jgi:hypothetical protein
MPLTKITTFVTVGRLSDFWAKVFESLNELFRIPARKGIAPACKVNLDDAAPEGVVKDPAVNHYPYADAKCPAKTGFALGKASHLANRNLDDKRWKAESEHLVIKGDDHL